MKKLEENFDEELKFCDYSCKHIKFNKKQPLCQTFDIIYCRKYKIERNKGDVCLDHKKSKYKN